MKLLSILTEQLLWYYDYSPTVIKKSIQKISKIIFKSIYIVGRLRPTSKLPLEIYKINPNEINFISDRTENSDIFSKYYFHGSILHGNWDKEVKSLKKDSMYQFAIDVFINNHPYQDTLFYKQVLNHERENYIKDKDQLKKRLDAWYKLYYSIKQDGIILQEQIKNGHPLDEICISIDRKGNKILEDGRHRFIIAHILGIKIIPVIINRIHSGYWMKNKFISLLPYKNISKS